MLILDATTKTFEIDMDEALTTSQLDVMVCYVDILTSDQSVSAFGNQDSATNSTTAVTILSAPAAGHTRTVKYMSVYNKDTVDHNVTIQLNNNATLRIIHKVLLLVGETLEYVA